jgi:hypothetical protein
MADLDGIPSRAGVPLNGFTIENAFHRFLQVTMPSSGIQRPLAGRIGS